MRRLCVFCGSRMGASPAFEAAAIATGRALAKRNIGLVYGGGSVGLMGKLADACLEAGGEAIGVIPDGLFAKEVAHTGLTRLERTDGMHPRKMRMAELSDGFLVLPGGVGTLEEMFEAVTWRSIGVHRKPSGVLDIEGLWTPLKTLLDHLVESKFVDAQVVDDVLFSSDVEELIDRVLEAADS